MMQVVTSNAELIVLHSPEDFETVFHVRYLPGLKFSKPKIENKLKQLCAKALTNKWITLKQKWLGSYYSEGFQRAPSLDLSIKWINSKVGYGVWTNRFIAANTFVGEYTGVIRKQRFWGRWENPYCFDYTMGLGRSTSFVIDAKKEGNHTRFINHSFEPNLELVTVYYAGMMHAILYAKTDIQAGTQLCYDYGEEYWANRGKPLELAANG